MFFKKFRNKNKFLRKFRKNDGYIVYMNDHINLIYEASKSCYGNSNITDNVEEKLDYIARRIKDGHESILEHSNIIMKINFQNNFDMLNDLTKAMCNMNYLRFFIRESKTFSNENYMIIGGSIRGYKNYIRDCKYDELFAPITKIILNNLYNINKEYFIDFISDGIMNESMFSPLNPADFNESTHLTGENCEILNIDNISSIKEIIDTEESDNVPLYNLMDVCTISVLFKDLSRAATHQLVRHRNAITQESQRYTSYNQSRVTDPSEFKDKYDANKKYYIGSLGRECTFRELGTFIVSMYNDLRDQGVDKEDARGYLPINVQCQKLYMTFTFRNLFKFFELRTGDGAQAEIKSAALELLGLMEPVLNILDIEDYNTFLINRYIFPISDNLDNPYEDIDEKYEEEVKEYDLPIEE